MSNFEAGKQAALEGKLITDNPHTDGLTKLGNVRLTEAGIEWENGFKSAKVRWVSKEDYAKAMKGNPFSERKFKRRPWRK